METVRQWVTWLFGLALTTLICWKTYEAMGETNTMATIVIVSWVLANLFGYALCSVVMKGKENERN